MEDETKIKVLPNPDDNVQGAAALITNETRSPERITLDTDQDCLIQQTEDQASTNSIVTTNSERRRLLPSGSICNSCRQSDIAESNTTDSDRGSKTRSTSGGFISNIAEEVRNDYLNPNAILFSAVISLPLYIAMILMGSEYSDQKYCKLAIPHCLMVMGSIGICFSLLTMISVLCGSAGITILKLISSLTRLVVLIWASVEIFGPYKHWHYGDEHKNDSNYCAYRPFMMSFIVLILNWVFLAMQLNCRCTGLTGLSHLFG